MKRPAFIAMLTMLAAAAPVLLLLAGVFARWENAVYDAFSRSAALEGVQSDRVAVIMVDKASLDWGMNYYLNYYAPPGSDGPGAAGGAERAAAPAGSEQAYIFTWPWNRLVYDLMIMVLAEAQARVFAFDFLFSEPYPRDDGNGDASLGTSTLIQNSTGAPYVIHALGLVESSAGRGSKDPANPPKDPPAAGGGTAEIDAPSPAPPAGGRTWAEIQEACLQRSAALSIDGIDGCGLPFDRSNAGAYADHYLPTADILRPFVQAGEESLLRLGAVCAQPDFDAVIRRVRPLVRYRGRAFPSLGLAAALAFAESEGNGRAASARIEERDLILDLPGSGHPTRFPLTPSGDILIKWRDPGRERGGEISSGYFPVYSAQAVIRSSLEALNLPPDAFARGETVDPSVFKDRIVFLGANAPGLYDLKATPISENYPGVLVNAALAEGLLAGEAVRRLGTLPRSAIAAALAAAACLLTVLTRSNVLKVAAVLAASGAYAAAAWALFQHASLWIDVATPVFGMALAYTGGTTYNYFTEGRRSRQISHLFQHFAPPDVVRQLIANPEDLYTAGKNRDVTVFFSDIQGFTSISNSAEMRSDPGRLTSHLNEYLSEMTQAIVDCGGTLDKYIGDAVVAIFGAPLARENHARDACRAALECQRRLEGFNTVAAERGLPRFVTRIGLYSGEATVGCVGSRNRFSYTAIGSTVNFASRLEGVNKVYGTRILAGGPTLERAAGTVQARLLDRVRVPGVLDGAPPLQVFEIAAMADRPHPLDSATLNVFEQALALYQQGRFREAAALFDKARKNSGDPPSVVLFERCLRFAESPPPGTWDGVYRIESK